MRRVEMRASGQPENPHPGFLQRDEEEAPRNQDPRVKAQVIVTELTFNLSDFLTRDFVMRRWSAWCPHSIDDTGCHI